MEKESKWRMVTGIMKTMWSLTKEDWGEMDHKLIRIISGAVGFILAAVFYFYFFRNVLPNPFF